MGSMLLRLKQTSHHHSNTGSFYAASQVKRHGDKVTMTFLFRSILKSEGVLGLYRGITPNFMKVGFKEGSGFDLCPRLSSVMRLIINSLNVVVQSRTLGRGRVASLPPHGYVYPRFPLPQQPQVCQLFFIFATLELYCRFFVIAFFSGCDGDQLLSCQMDGGICVPRLFMALYIGVQIKGVELHPEYGQPS